MVPKLFSRISNLIEKLFKPSFLIELSEVPKNVANQREFFLYNLGALKSQKIWQLVASGCKKLLNARGTDSNFASIPLPQILLTLPLPRKFCTMKLCRSANWRI